MDDVDQLLGSDGPRIILGQVGIHEVLANMILDNLGDEPFERAPTGSGLLENPAAFTVFFDGTLDRFNLALDAFQAVEELLSSLDVSHL